jgi:hypothetical protein
MKMEQTVCSRTSAYNIQMPGNYPEESIKHTKNLINKLKHMSKLCLRNTYAFFYNSVNTEPLRT